MSVILKLIKITYLKLASLSTLKVHLELFLWLCNTEVYIQMEGWNKDSDFLAELRELAGYLLVSVKSKLQPQGSNCTSKEQFELIFSVLKQIYISNFKFGNTKIQGLLK